MSEEERLLSSNIELENKSASRKNPEMDIYHASKEGKLEIVEHWLKSGIKATVADYDDRTPLHIASGKGHTKVVELLLDEGANVNARDVHQWTPLDEAIRNHQEEVANILRDRGGKNGCEAMVKPVRHKQLECLESVAAGDLKNVIGLIGSIGGVNFSDYDGRTPLHLAVAEGHYEVAKWLIEYCPQGEKDEDGHWGAKKFAKDRWGTTPADEAKRHQVRSGQDKMTPLFHTPGDDDHHHHSFWSPFSKFLFLAEIVLIVLLCTVCEYSDAAYAPVHLNIISGQSNNSVIPNSLIHRNAIAGYNNFVVLSGHDHSAHGPDAHDPHAPNDPPEADEKHDANEEHDGHEADTAHEGHDHDEGHGHEPSDPFAGAEMMKKYPQFMDVHVMIFVGFGFLMTFLKKHAYNSLGLTFLVSAFAIQWHILCGGFFEHLIVEGHLSTIYVSLETLILADFACGAVLITYGVLLGKVSPFQLLTIAILEVMFFSINESIGLKLVITDVGGSMVVHMFGAFFGLTASLVMKNKEAMGNTENAAVYHSDVFAMIGTVFLWLFWPSFNGALTSENRQMRVVINTVLSLAGSCVAGYLASYVMRRERKFDMVDVQNATLAGGVAMGTCADLIVQPGPAVLLGAIAGFVSVFGYVHVQPWLESNIGLHDTCGVHNLHGMPSILGAIAGVIAVSQATQEKYGDHTDIIFHKIFTGERTGVQQALIQLGFIGITLGIAIIGGAISGIIVNGLGNILDPLNPNQLFKDEQHWEVPGLEQPYYFDHRGEIRRDPKKDDNVNKDVTLKLEGLIEKVKLLEKKAQQGSTFDMNVGTFLEKLIPKIADRNN